MSEQPSLARHPHPYPGKLITVEGIDGSGKSTQLQLLHKWLESKGHRVFFTEWNSSELVKETTNSRIAGNLLRDDRPEAKADAPQLKVIGGSGNLLDN